MKHPNPKSSHLDDLSQTFNALANPNRLSIVSHLKRGEMTVNALAIAVGLSQSALSQHLIKLRDTGIVEVRKHRQMRYYALTAAAVAISFIQELGTIG